MDDTTPVDEDLNTGPSHRFPRWLGPLVGVVLVAVGVILLFTKNGSDHKPAPTPTGTAPPSDGSARALVGVPSHGQFVELVGDRLQILRPDGSRAHRSPEVHAVGTVSDRVTLSVDAVAKTVWVVATLNNEAGYAESYSLDDLHALQRVPLTAPVRSAAAVGGRLYIVLDQSIAVLAGAKFVPVSLSGYVESVTADPTRARLLAAVVPRSGALELTALRGTTPGPVSRPLPGSPTTVVAAGGSIWIDGYDQIIGLDPVSLAPRINVAVPHADGEVQLVSTGDSSLFMRLDDSQHPLACADAATGRQRQYWPDVPGTVAATRHRALVAPILGPPKNLELSGCAG